MLTVYSILFTIGYMINVSQQAISNHFNLAFNPALSIGRVAQLGVTSKVAVVYSYSETVPTVFIVDARAPNGGTGAPIADSQFNPPSSEWTAVQLIYGHPTDSNLVFVIQNDKIF